MIWSAFILGLLGSFHCIGMCGPIALMLPIGKSTPLQKGVKISLYNLGRITSYAIIGLVFGLLGEGLMTFGVQQQISILIGIIMILAVLIPSSKLNRFKVTQPLYRLIGKVKKEMGIALKKDANSTFFQLGFLNGFLPCGLVYMAVFASIATPGLWESAVYMMVFGLGTVPIMAGVIYFKSHIEQITRWNPRKIIPYAVVILGILFILRGLGLGIPYISPKPVNTPVDSKIECHI